MTKAQTPKIKLNYIKAALKRAADKFGVDTTEVTKAQLFECATNLKTWHIRELGGLNAIKEHCFPTKAVEETKAAKVLIFDIETAPMLAYAWAIWDQNIGLNQIKDDWFVLSWAAKWLGDSPSKIMYQDQRNAADVKDDKELLGGIWKLLDEADIVIGQNCKKFDIKKLNARFLHHGMQPPSSYRVIDTVNIAKKNFAFTSNKLEYMTDKFCTKYKKLSHKKYPGFSLWSACLAGDKAAWTEMERYNKYDVLSLEELYEKVSAWDNSINHGVYSNELEHVCSCGSKEFSKRGFVFTSMGKFQRYKCQKCGKETRGKENLLSPVKRKLMHKG